MSSAWRAMSQNGCQRTVPISTRPFFRMSVSSWITSQMFTRTTAMYETRDDTECLPPGSANPNAFSDMVLTRTRSRTWSRDSAKGYNDAHPNLQVTGDDIISARFEYLPAKVAPCALTARRNHGTKTPKSTNNDFYKSSESESASFCISPAPKCLCGPDFKATARTNHGYPTVPVRHQSTRLGSCSGAVAVLKTVFS